MIAFELWTDTNDAGKIVFIAARHVVAVEPGVDADSSFVRMVNGTRYLLADEPNEVAACVESELDGERTERITE